MSMPTFGIYSAYPSRWADPRAVHQDGCIAVARRGSMLSLPRPPLQPMEFAITGSTPVLVPNRPPGGSGGAITWPRPSQQARWVSWPARGLGRA